VVEACQRLCRSLLHQIVGVEFATHRAGQPPMRPPPHWRQAALENGFERSAVARFRFFHQFDRCLVTQT
jgi:hypothetical protein